MNFRMLAAVLPIVLASCAEQVPPAEKPETNVIMENDTIGRVTGIGGIFFKSKDPKAQREWYAQHLRMETNDYGSLFEFREVDDPNKKGHLQWSPFSEDTKYFLPSEREFMINYRVKNMEALVEQLRAASVTICDSIEEYEYGKFIHIMDPEGNKIELWEPSEEGFGDSE